MKRTFPINIFTSKHSIRTRLIFLFLISIAIIFVGAGYYLKWQIRGTLDEALGENLESIAATFAFQVEPEFLQLIQPGDENTRTYRNLREQLSRFQQITGVNHVFIFNEQMECVVDADSLKRIGQLYIHLKYDQPEVQQVFAGQTASSVLFKGIDGSLYKSGFAPVKIGEQVVAGLAVEGSAEMLKAVALIQKNLIYLGIIVLLGAIILGSFFANRITTPLKKLESAAAAISQGNFHHPIPNCGRDEVGFLSKTMETMRKNIMQRDKHQQAMLAGVAHEIRNPLGGIELFAGLLSSEMKDLELKSYAQKIQKEVLTLKSIIQSFLDFARPTVPDRQRCNIQASWQEAVLLVSGELDGIQLKLNPSAGLYSAFVDSQHLKQIFLNLLKNSIQAMPAGGTVFVKIEKSAHRIHIFYSDSGPGIPEKLVVRIFDPFFTTREKGSGLGLAVVKNLLAENGGTIQYQSQPKGGAGFLIDLPLHEVTAME